MMGVRVNVCEGSNFANTVTPPRHTSAHAMTDVRPWFLHLIKGLLMSMSTTSSGLACWNLELSTHYLLFVHIFY